MNKIEECIKFYLTSRDVYTVEKVFNELVRITTPENYMHIVNSIDRHKNATHELDLSTYIAEIASNKYPKLETIIHDKLKTYTDKDAIDDLQNALKKLEIETS